MPLQWEEVIPQLNIRSFTIANASDRMRKLKGDPLRELLDVQPDITAALERLAKR
jgi:DNA primase